MLLFALPIIMETQLIEPVSLYVLLDILPTSLQEGASKYVLLPSMEMIQPVLGIAILHQLIALMASVTTT